MKFLLITHIYPPAIDGGSKVIAKMGEYLAKDGHHIRVLTSDCRSTDDFVTPSDSLIVRQSDDLNIVRLPVYHRLRQPLKALRLFLGLFCGTDSYLVQLFEIFEKGPIFKFFPFFSFLVSSFQFHPDYILTGPLPTTIVLYARFISLLTHSKLIINASFHTTDPAFNKKPLIGTLRSADYLWTLTDHETHYFHKKFHIPHSKLLQLGNGVDPNFLSSSPSTIDHRRSNLLYIGAFAAHKNIPVLIRAFDILAPQFPDLTLTLAGQKTLFFPEIQKLLNMLPDNIRHRIHIIFDFLPKKLAKLYDHASILIQPSTQESFGLTLVEAWARRLPVVASNIPTFKELVTKSQGGLNFEVANAHDLAAKIQDLLLDSQLRQDLSQNGYNYVTQHFVWDKIAHSLCQKLSI